MTVSHADDTMLKLISYTLKNCSKKKECSDAVDLSPAGTGKVLGPSALASAVDRTGNYRSREEFT